MNFDRSFKKQSILVQVLLLLIPGVNWITEILVRASAWSKHRQVLNLVILILVVLGGFFIGWLDLIWQLLFGHLICEK